MSFPRKVRNQILVDTARHCCVCHRYKGVKVEVHHIEQEALGGENTYENAISLCFDCHADAGHYNSKHPRGTKFSPSELKMAKESWIALVKENNLKEPSEPDSFLCQYFICENYENLLEIYDGDLSKFPVENPLLVKNEIFEFLSQVIEAHPESYRHANSWGESYKSKEDYLSRHPDAIVTKEHEGDYPYFEVVRTPTKEELYQLAPKDGVLRLMLDHNMPIESISAIVGCYEDACAGIELQEEYIFRKLWCAFAAITNISNQPLAIESIEAYKVLEEGFISFSDVNDEVQPIDLPKMPISPGSTVIIPIAVLLPPLYSLEREEWSSTSSGGWEEQVQVVTHGSVTIKNVKDTLTFGGAIFPLAVKYNNSGNIYSQEFHIFDLTNMYCISRHWQCGSCPHLFFIQSEVRYERELLAHCETTVGQDEFIVPKGVNSLIIAEIEDEVTEIESIHIDGDLYLENLILDKSEYIEIPVSEFAEVVIVGRYVPNSSANKKFPQGIKRNDLVGQFIFSQSNWPNKSVHGTPALTRLHP